MSAETTTALLDAALDYAVNDFTIFLLNGKIPFAGGHDCPSGHQHQHGHLDATIDPTIIRAWWTAHPTANIGVATGKAGGVVVFDVDSTEGWDTFTALGVSALGGREPRGTVPGEDGSGPWVAKTARGYHVFFAHPGDGEIRNRAGLMPGVDVRGDGGYVVAPPSVHASGTRYEWLTPPGFVPLAPLPNVLRVLLVSSTNGNGHHVPVTDAEIIPEGQRNATLFREARSRLARGASPEAIKAKLLDENAARCVPPLDEAEVLAIADHAVTEAHRPDFARMSDDEAAAYAARRRAKRRTLAVAPAVPPSGSSAEPVKAAAGGPLAPLDALGEASTLDDVERALRQVSGRLAKAKADALARAVARAGAVERLERRGVSSPAKLVDAALKGHEAEPDAGQGQSLMLKDVEPWPEAVEGETLLADLEAALRRFVVLPEGAATAIVLWVVFAHAHEASDVSPLLTISSPTLRCGKSTLRAVLGKVVPRALPTSNATPAVLFRVIEAKRPTLLVDEGDTFLKLSDEMRGVLNSGHTRSGAAVLRTVGDEHEPRAFSTWCPKVLALIGKLPPTLHDRSVVIPMKRRRLGQRVERLREAKLRELEPLARQAARWAWEHERELRRAEPEVPEALDDRAQDNWRPLLAIADRVGGAWPSRARAAALTLSGLEGRAEEVVGVQLLADLRDLFEERAAQGKPDKLASAELASQLGEMGDRPWSDWRHGKPLTQRALAKLLAPFGVTPQQQWVPVAGGGRNVKGYAAEQFREAWDTYLAVPGGFDPLGPLDPNRHAGSSPSDDPLEPPPSSPSLEPLDPNRHAGSSPSSGSKVPKRGVRVCVCPTCAQAVPVGGFAGHWAGHLG